MLVSYSDSEGSDDESSKVQTVKLAAKPSATSSISNFAVDRSTGKIKVNLQQKPDPTTDGTHEDEPAAKRPRLGAGGGGAFSGFNAMLPAPKRDNLLVAQQNGTNKAPTRKVFSLRTGAEPAFSRESDAELRDLFSEQTTNGVADHTRPDITIPTSIPKPAFAKPAPPAPAGKSFMFKPLSVARNTKKKKLPTGAAGSAAAAAAAAAARETNAATTATAVHDAVSTPAPPKKKISLFSAGTDVAPPIPAATNGGPYDDDDEIIEDLGPTTAEDDLDAFQPSAVNNYHLSNPTPDPQSLTTIADDLNLTAAERRQLFGRSANSNNTFSPSHSSNTVTNVVNFNTDAEYAANQQLIASGEQAQHNPVRAIASGKHSLRQLVSSAADQKQALEESFASGKRNKREAGSKYGW